ncbi:alpha/beta hydrolase [Amycolatopsis cihanbeyliensis]|uniref:Alpha/beta hydrolase family protein n=1 Tax=Amycolatopsis cihanbeyliensis TaxID=1128664 RepID=A0A542DQU6_AMYCI|nr:alpha/beta hydrolase [Amycolatopsis cihanbeyliensis]TQJ05479.1 alpha/beta hydrolase family protein [Amycolatopsis cihanbeyliensis]
MRHSFLSVAAAALVAAPLLVASPAPAHAAELDWQPCPDDAALDCATLAVPLSWAEPDGERIELSLVRREGTAKAGDGLGTLVYGPGGPGGSGVTDLKYDPIFQKPVYQHYDVVSYDSRGIGESSPIRCETDNFVRDWPTTREEFRTQLRNNRAYMADCRERTGPVYDHVDTRSDVRDLDAIRAALGEDKLNYYGVSYGTLRGQQYAEMFPERVGKLILDSTMDHSIDNTWDFMRTETGLREEMFGLFLEWCAEQEECALHGRDVEALTDRLYERAAEGELTDPNEPGSKLDEIGLALSMENLVLGRQWPKLADHLVALEQQADPRMRAAGIQQVGNEPSKPIWCNDWNYRVNTFAEADRLADRLAEAAPNVRFSSYDYWAVACLGWPRKPVNQPHELELSEQVPPILIANARFDPATVYPWAQAVAEQSGMPLLTYDGGGHGMYFVDSCSREYMHDYLLTGKTPPDGTHCPTQDGPAARSAEPALPMPPSLTTGFA